ncbi:porin [Roseinatronobacter alkalisoli]|uniref:Porin n=1 Tax=Roseinatronobacter alkalisoli TaxID=3028235 RepID=A0ABT5T355_9RHOB|nr:porin [Roseinatronobacter sp. HJB301]MDD7969550.1 porin [Roseinatronobacter sp. HJB301]
MKKLLLASTALVMTAGAAAAQVNMTGSARMGIIYDNLTVNDGVTNNAKLQFTSRIRVAFSMSGETDSGLAFGASIRGDQFGVGNAGNSTMTGGTVYISGEFGKLTFGDVAGAARAAVGDLYAVGLTGIGDLNEMGYLDRTFSVGLATNLNRRTAVLYEYSLEGFTFYASLGQNRRTDDLVNGRDTDQLAAIGAKYTFDGFTVSAGYEMGEAKNVLGGVTTKLDANHLIIGAEYAMDNFKVKAIAGRVGGDLGTALSAAPGFSRSQYGLSVEGEFDATTVTAFVNRNFETTDYGIGASYDLGGGAALVGGISRSGSNSTTGATNRTRADLGLNFSF